MTYRQLLRSFSVIDRTRVFGTEWHVTSQWTTVAVPWANEYVETCFELSVVDTCPAVVVLSQVSQQLFHVLKHCTEAFKLDTRSFEGLQGPYDFHLQFRIARKIGKGIAEEFQDSNPNLQSAFRPFLSVNAELDLKSGEYYVVFKVKARRHRHRPTTESMCRANRTTRPAKLRSVGRRHDWAHARGTAKDDSQQLGDIGSEFPSDTDGSSDESHSQRCRKIKKEENIENRKKPQPTCTLGLRVHYTGRQIDIRVRHEAANITKKLEAL